MSSQSNALDLGAVFGTAAASGDISAQTQQILMAPDLGQHIQAGLGLAADMFQASEAFLCGMLLDDSGSIRMAGNSDVVRQGANTVKGALRQSKTNSGILMRVEALNHGPLRDAKGNPLAFVTLDQIPDLDSRNYNADGGTPLYDRMVEFLALMMAKTEEYKQSGIEVRSSSLIVTDGRDEGSYKHTEASVAALVRDMLMTERHIVAFMGIARMDRGKPLQSDVDLYKRIALACGIEEKWILTPGSTETEIRRAFQQFSRSSQQASQGAAGHSKAFQAGFATVAP